jgi:hypothetical protein
VTLGRDAHDEVRMDLFPAAGGHLGDAWLWDLVDVFVEHDFDPTSSHASLKRSAEFVGIGTVEKLRSPLYDCHFFVLGRYR